MELFNQNFVNVTEQLVPVTASVKGDLPDWLKGDLIRVGPGKFDINDFCCNHWLDGMAMIYKFTFDNQKVTFSKRFVQSDAYKKACKVGKPVFTEFGTRAYPDPSKSLFSRMLSTFDATAVTDNASINIMRLGKEVFVSSETCYMRRIDTANLDTKEKIDFNKLAGINFAASHVLNDNDGNSYNIGMTVLSGPKYNVLKTTNVGNKKGEDVWKETKIIATIPSSWKTSYSYVHSFGLTENYVVFVEQPLIVNTFKLATSQVKGRSLVECIEWHPQENVRFHIVNKNTGEVLKTKYMTDEPFFVLHNVNAFESDGQIVLDLIAYPNPDLLSKLFLEKVRANAFEKGASPQLKRFVIPLVEKIEDVSEGENLVKFHECSATAARVQDNKLGDRIVLEGMSIAEPGFDMPVIAPSAKFKEYRYIYANGGFDQGYYKNSVCKVDLQNNTTQLWRETEYQYPSEPVFVPRPDALKEDDGILLVPLCDTRPNHPNAMVILDASTFECIARVEVDMPIPNGLHGIFVPRDR